MNKIKKVMLHAVLTITVIIAKYTMYFFCYPKDIER